MDKQNPQTQVRQRTILQSYAGVSARRDTWRRQLKFATVLPAKTRMRISLAVCAFAALGIYVSDKLEEAVPAPKEQDKHIP